jgi:hypothetical protein
MPERILIARTKSRACSESWGTNALEELETYRTIFGNHFMQNEAAWEGGKPGKIRATKGMCLLGTGKALQLGSFGWSE